MNNIDISQALRHTRNLDAFYDAHISKWPEDPEDWSDAQLAIFQAWRNERDRRHDMINNSRVAMHFLRWVIFFPVLLLTTVLVQSLAGYLGETGPWWIWLFVYLLFGWYVSGLIIFVVSRICPNPKFGCYAFLGLFVTTEMIAFFGNFAGRSALENILRGGTDLSIVAALFASANSSDATSD